MNTVRFDMATHANCLIKVIGIHLKSFNYFNFFSSHFASLSSLIDLVYIDFSLGHNTYIKMVSTKAQQIKQFLSDNIIG